VVVGNYCSLAEGSTLLLNADHHTEWASTYPFAEMLDRGRLSAAEQPIASGVLRIGHDVWIGTNTTIKGGVDIGTGAVIAAGAVVTSSIDPYTVVGGVPARTIKRRFSDEIIAILESSRWWEIAPESITEELADTLSQPPSTRSLDVLQNECERLRQLI
jgi:acetyltransferase-like isoleucine patch superfamily enzyme